MAISQTRAAFVNRSSTNIPVSSGLVASFAHNGGKTVNGNISGYIYLGECYTIIPLPDSYTLYNICFRDNTGKQANGYIESSPGETLGLYAWANYQEQYHYYNSNGSALVASATVTIANTIYRQFTVKKAVKYYNPSGYLQGTLAVGTKLATRVSTTGQTYPNLMLFTKKYVSGIWVDLCSSGYGFVDLGFNVGSKLTNRAIDNVQATPHKSP